MGCCGNQPSRGNQSLTRPKHNNVLIVARSGGMLARAAAKAGYLPRVIDLFGDTDTSSAAMTVRVIDTLPGMLLDPDAVIAAMAGISSEFGEMPLVWGAGLELQPSLLCALEQRVTVAGCSAKTVFDIVDPHRFCRTLDAHRIPCPRVHPQNPGDGGRWLVKTMGGCGGGHVRPADGHRYCGHRQYLQQFVDGVSMSVVFIADQEGAQVLGFLEHLRLQPDPDSPFRYGGAVTCPELKLDVMKRVEDYVRRLSAHYALKGLCGVDFVLGPDDSTTVIELNPRPTATFGLVAPAGQAFMAHMSASLHWQHRYSRISHRVAAHAVVYTSRAGCVAGDIQWPAWVTDRPRMGTCFSVGDPLCSISVVADTPLAARQLLEQRFRILRHQMVSNLFAITDLKE